MATTTLDYLIPYVRLRLGDTNADSYRYLTEWIYTALVSAVNTLGNWWNIKYFINDNDEVYRNTLASFTFAEPPVVEAQDNQTIVLMATYIMLEGSLENSAWDFVSWKDAEISFSNLESARSRNSTLDRLWTEIMATLKPPTKRLARTIKGDLPGYLNNPYESGK